VAEPLDPDREAGPAPLPDSNGSDGDLSEDDLDIDALVLVWKDDLLLDAIGGASKESDRLDVPFDASADRQLIEALLSWRRDIESDPLAPVGPDRARDAAGDLDACEPRRHRFRVPLVSALAAAVVIAFTALAAYGAVPNEALWPVTEVLYSQHAASIRAADDAGVAQAQAEAAMAAGQTHEAEAALHAAASRLPQVRSEDGQTKLQNRQRDLERQLDAPPAPAATRKSVSEPGAPTRSPKISAAPKPTSRQTTHSSRPESPSARANGSHDSITQTGPATTTPQTHPTSQSAPENSTSPPHHEQPGQSPRPTRSAATTTSQPAPSTARTDTRAAQDNARRAQPVKPSNKKSLPTTPQPETQATSGQAAKPSSSVRTPANRPSQAAAKQSNSPAPTPRQHATPSPDSAPS
jgi:hypothetical protein